MSDTWCVVLAAAAMLGAWQATPIATPLVLVAALAALATLVGRRTRTRPLLVCLAAALAASLLGARAWDGVRAAPTTGDVHGDATVVRDPELEHGSVRIELRLRTDGRRVLATARGDPGTVLLRRLAGEHVDVEGRRTKLSPAAARYLAGRHIGAGLRITKATPTSSGGAVARLTNQFRRTLVDGADPLAPRQRALFTGLVLGDDRDQEPADVEDFRASGLSHLLAVSGQNLAFALAVAAPFLRRLQLRGRFVAGAAVLVVFGSLTRWEPSVLRAVGMAFVAMSATTLGRPVSSIRVLALATTGLVLVDPMLATSVGFLLSVGACTGIAVLTPPLERRRVPTTLAVTLAAQAGVAPVLLPVFGSVPLASLPANLLAVPVAGPVMVWGLVAGPIAGLLGGRPAELLHLPTALALTWIGGVARACASAPLPQLGPVGVAVTAATLVVVHALRGRPARALLAGLGVTATVAVAASARPPPDLDGLDLGIGVQAWRTAGAVVVVAGGNADEGALVRGLREQGIRRVDVLVLRSNGSAAARLAAAVRARGGARLVVAPPGRHVPGATAVPVGRSVVDARTAKVLLRATAGHLDADVVASGTPVDPDGP